MPTIPPKWMNVLAVLAAACAGAQQALPVDSIVHAVLAMLLVGFAAVGVIPPRAR